MAAAGTLPAECRSPVNTERWFYGVFQSAPDLIRWLVGSPAAAVPLELDRHYRFSAPELQAAGHRLDGVLWPLSSETGSDELPVVFLQLHPRIEHWRVVVLTPHRRLNLGPTPPLRSFLESVLWVGLDELGQQVPLDAALELLTLPVQPQEQLGERCRRILTSRRDLEPVILSMLFERFSQLSREEILMIVGLPLQQLRHTRAGQEILEEGRKEGREAGREEGRQEGREAGRQQEAAALAIRQLHRRFLELGPATSERIAALPLPRLEQLAEDLLDFTGPEELEHWLANNSGG